MQYSYNDMFSDDSDVNIFHLLVESKQRNGPTGNRIGKLLYRGKSSTVPIYVPMIYLYHRLEQPLYYLLLFIAQAASDLSLPSGFPQRFDSLRRSQQGPPSTCKTWRHGDSAWIQEAVIAMGSDHCHDSHPL